MIDLPGGSAPADGGRAEEAGPTGPEEPVRVDAAADDGASPPTGAADEEAGGPGEADAPGGPPLLGRTTPGIDLPGPRSVRDAWRRAGTPGRIGLALASIAALALLGAFLFGFWHVLWGGFVRGNWRAGGFGIALASACGVLLWIDAIVLRRLGARA